MNRAQDVSGAEDQCEGHEVAHEDPSQENVGKLAAARTDDRRRAVAEPHAAYEAATNIVVVCYYRSSFVTIILNLYDNASIEHRPVSLSNG